MTSDPHTPALDPALVEAIAQRTAEIVLAALAGGATPTAGRQLVDATALAEALGVSRDYVYAHADEYHPIRLGEGPRARLRFDLDRALAAHRLRPAPRRVPEPTQLRRRRAAERPGLLPIAGQRAAA